LRGKRARWRSTGRANPTYMETRMLVPSLDVIRRTIAIEAAYTLSRGVDFVCSAAEFLSGSHRNMERAGMRVQFVRAVWMARG